MASGEKLTVVLVPFPYQGHTTPMLQLASILHSNGFSIIVAHADINSPHPSNHPGLVFQQIPSNLPDTTDKTKISNLASVIMDLNNNLKAPLEDYLVRLLSDKEGEQHGRRIVCLVRDSVMYFAESVAANFKLPSLVLRTSMAAAVQPYHYLLQLQEQNRLPFPESKMREQVPELAPLLFKDFAIPPTSEIKEEIRHLISCLNGIKTSVGIIWNSMDHLEHKPLTELQQFYKVPFFPIGPLHKTAAPTSTSFLEEDLSCLFWLDKQAPNSVLYISVGSIASIEDGEELTETAWGLANSGQPFLWVVRPRSVEGVEYWDEKLPEGFREIVGERGQIVKWAPQKQVLAHSAVGGFWSHCGWNSTMESICEGVPMICTPFFGDQKVNARYLIDKWKVGLQIENVKDRNAIEKSIRRLMIYEEGQEMRERVLQMKAKAETAMQEGGSSYESLRHLTEFISSLSICRGQEAILSSP